jgi:type I restriction enzyme S subunit
MNSRVGRVQVEGVQYGTAQKQFNISDAVNFKYPVPTLAEQETIAGALSDADAWIESLEQLIAKKRQIKQGAMQELLTGKTRLPGFSGEWETKSLGDLGRCQRGVCYNPNTDLYPFDTPSSVRLLRSNNVQDAAVVLDDVQFVDSSRVSPDQYLTAGDVLICMANGSRSLVGKAGRFQSEQELEALHTYGAFMGSFRPSTESSDPTFVFYLFQTDAYRRHVMLLLAGSSINNLTPASLESHTVQVPAIKAEQTAIATVLSDMDAEIASLEAKLTKARQIKQGMMQELLTGRIRLG